MHSLDINISSLFEITFLWNIHFDSFANFLRRSENPSLVWNSSITFWNKRDSLEVVCACGRGGGGTFEEDDDSIEDLEATLKDFDLNLFVWDSWKILWPWI